MSVNFENPVPVFEIGKDSYILKHKLDYNTSCGDDWSGVTNKILFTDYDLARKSQTTNSQDFEPIIITEDLTDYSFFEFIYYDQNYGIGLYGRLLFTDIVSGTTFINNPYYQQYYIESGLTILINNGDYFNVYFHDIETVTGTTQWEHIGPSGDTWIKTGSTENNIDWQVSGITTENGISTGTETWQIEDYKPILKYQAKVIEVGTNYIRVEKKIEDYLYNNILNDYDNAYYVLESMDFTTKTYYSIKYILQESNWNNYFDFNASNTGLTITPIQNINDIYFDYGNVDIILTHTGGTTDYKFETNCLYTNYKFDKFFEQLGFETGHTIQYNYLADVTSQPYNNEIEFDIEMTNSGDTLFFTPYTYVITQANNLSGETYISLIKEISGTTITLITSKDLLSGDTMININNLYTIGEISDMLYECYINIDSLYISDYRKINIETRKYIYNAYINIIDDLDINENVRDKIVGMVYENENNVYTFKLYNPTNFQDDRLLYKPIEIMRIGKNKKTGIPVNVYGTTSGFNFNLIDCEIYDVDLYDSNIWDSNIVFDSNSNI